MKSLGAHLTHTNSLIVYKQTDQMDVVLEWLNTACWIMNHILIDRPEWRDNRLGWKHPSHFGDKVKINEIKRANESIKYTKNQTKQKTLLHNTIPFYAYIDSLRLYVQSAIIVIVIKGFCLWLCCCCCRCVCPHRLPFVALALAQSYLSIYVHTKYSTK